MWIDWSTGCDWRDECGSTWQSPAASDTWLDSCPFACIPQEWKLQRTGLAYAGPTRGTHGYGKGLKTTLHSVFNVIITFYVTVWCLFQMTLLMNKFHKITSWMSEIWMKSMLIVEPKLCIRSKLYIEILSWMIETWMKNHLVNDNYNNIVNLCTSPIFNITYDISCQSVFFNNLSYFVGRIWTTSHRVNCS